MFEFCPEVTWSTIVQLLGIVGAIWGVSYQMNKQREMQLEKHKIELQLKTYERITNNIENSSPTGLATTFNILCGCFDDARKKSSENKEYVPPPFHPEEIHKTVSEVFSKLWKVSSTIEKYEIVSPHMPLFREALVKSTRELSNAYLPLVRVMPYLLVSKENNGKQGDFIIPNESDIELLEKYVSSFNEISYDIAGYLYDIQVELQNSLLGEFFERKLSVRFPKDNDVLVLNSKDSHMLKRVREYVNE